MMALSEERAAIARDDDHGPNYGQGQEWPAHCALHTNAAPPGYPPVSARPLSMIFQQLR